MIGFLNDLALARSSALPSPPRLAPSWALINHYARSASQRCWHDYERPLLSDTPSKQVRTLRKNYVEGNDYWHFAWWGVAPRHISSDGRSPSDDDDSAQQGGRHGDTTRVSLVDSERP